MCWRKPANSIKRFLDTGVLELGDRLGPLLWQFAPTKKFDPADFGKFLELLPAKAGNTALRHVVEVRHPSFCAPDFVALARSFHIPIVFTDHARYPSLADATGDFIYARLQKGQDTIPTAYPPKELDAWAKRLRLWAQGKSPEDLPHVDARKRTEDSRTARRVCLCHSRRQNPRAGRGDGADRAVEVGEW